MRPRPPLAFALIVLALIGIALPARALDLTRTDRSGLEDRAAVIWASLPTDARLAVRPLGADDSGVPEPIEAALESALLAALDRTRPPGAVLLPRRDIASVFEEAESFQGRDPIRLLSEMAASALLLARPAPTRSGLRLDLSVIAIEGAKAGGLLAAVEPLSLSFEMERAVASSPSVAARRAGQALAESLRTLLGATEAHRAQISLAGARTPFGDWFLGQVGEHLTARLAAAPLYVTRPLRALGQEPGGVRVALSADLFDLRGLVDVAITARAGPQAVATATTRLDKAALPGGFLPLTRDGGRVGAGRFRGRATAVESRRLSPDELSVAAAALARARAIDAALGGGRDRPDRISDRAAIAEAWRALEHGIPHEETLRPGARRSGSWTVAARVERVGGAAAPRLAVDLDRAVYRPGVPIRVLVRPRTPLFAAAFALQADGRVVRIAPLRAGEVPHLSADRQYELPGPGDIPVMATPLSGSVESVEAILLLASAVPFRGDDLAPGPPLLAAAGPASAAGIALGGFLDRLARLDLARATIRVLPYRVRGSHD